MLPREFTFSQNNLQYYADCKQRFFLKEIARLSWPANETEPVRLQEERMAIGSRFHLLCSQYFNGVPIEIIKESIDSSEMIRWWDSFLTLGLQPAPGNHPEKAITLPFANFRLTAHYDLLIKKSNEKYLIYDWKTNTRRPTRQHVQQRMQSLVYPLVLSLFLAHRESNKYKSPDIEMIYWYPEFPDQPHIFQYDSESFIRQKTELTEMINQISENAPKDYVITDNIKNCLYCQFRSYCNRGDRPGKFDEEFTPEE